MNAQAKQVMVECTHGSDANTLTFPEVVTKMIAAGIERYHADLLRAEKTYYLPNGESEIVRGETFTGAPPQAFAAAGVEAAVRAIQTGTIGYPEFCRRIIAAGCVGYLVSIPGRRAVYYGRTGETYVEPFPGAGR